MHGFTTRRLLDADRALIDPFLAARAPRAMFLRSNLRAAGMIDRGEPLEATYVGAFAGDALVGVTAHGWNGIVLLCADEPGVAAELAVAAVAETRAIERKLWGLVGPAAQVEAARNALRMRDARTTMDSIEDLFSLSLDALVVPAALRDGAVRGRRTREEDLPLVSAWRVEYSVEALGMARGPELDAGSLKDIRRLHDSGATQVLEVGHELVAYTAFNARLPDLVQVGGVYTPSHLRGRGFARCVVAAHLLEARSEGVSGAILFTDLANEPARKAYLSLGFRVIGDYAIVLFAR